ncbi:MAG: hypothetical protein IBX62_10150 [Coriobacteriia bacterium]|nr:hypothetical protein [Coriobacteriia bacterium]
MNLSHRSGRGSGVRGPGALLLALLLSATLLAGCDGDGDGVTPRPEETTPGEEATAPAPPEETLAEGEELVNERCTPCHSLDRVYAEDKDREGWTSTVDRMISLGAELDARERQVVIDYLTERSESP